MRKTQNDLTGARYGRKITTKTEKAKIKIAFLGGINEIGKNITVFEFEDDLILLDCGLAFPDAEMFGVDLVLPDFSYVEKNADRIKGIIVSHGHEDHIGGLPYLLKTIKAPVYATKLTIGLIKGKLKEHKILNSAELFEIEPGDIFTLGAFSIEAIHVNHSIPDAVAFAIKSPVGTILHTGDFKIDTTPVDGEVIDLSRFSALGNEGVLCLMADSTNAERPGYTESESRVGETLENLFRKAGGKRLIIATFASNIHRVQQIINAGAKLGRKVALSGRSLDNVVSVSTELGYLDVPEGVLVSIDDVKNYPDEKIIIITTGSQGEPMSALTRMSSSEHRKVKIGSNDFIIISATPIPGNERTVGNVVNELMKLGADVIYDRMYEVHVSGHARQEELKLIMGLTKPKFFIPVHGEQKHLRCHAKLAKSMGISEQNIIIADVGASVSLTTNKVRHEPNVPCGRVFVDGYGVGDVGSVVLRDRKRLSEDGVIVVTVAVDTYTGNVVTIPEIESKGFVYVKEADELFTLAKNTTYDVLDRFSEDFFSDIPALKSRLREEISRLMYEKTKRSPIILPIVLEINS